MKIEIFLVLSAMAVADGVKSVGGFARWVRVNFSKINIKGIE